MKNRIMFLCSTALASFAFTSAALAGECRVNLALSANGAVASQSSNPFGFGPAAGNDGLIATDFTFSHTGNGDSEWWQVNLGAPTTIAEVRVWLRSDSSLESSPNIFGRDANLNLIIYSDATLATVVYTVPFDGSAIPLPYRNVDLVLPAPVTGQVVRIQHSPGLGGTDAGYLVINECQVFNQAVPQQVDLALNGTASMSSIFSTYGAQFAIDGVNVGISGDGRTSSTAASGGPPDTIPSWQVDLGSMQTISSLRVFLVADQPQARNQDIAITVLDAANNVVVSNYSASAPPVVTLPGMDFPNNKQYFLYTFQPPISGETIKVQHTLTNAQYLTLSEVEVFDAYTNSPSINILQAPTNQTVVQFGSATLSVKACVGGANINYLSYQWQSNGVDIFGANGSTYSTAPQTQVGSNTYTVKLLLPGLTVSTNAVVKTVASLVPPSVATNTITVGASLNMTLGYSELVTPATATNTANYHFAGSPTLTNLTLLPDGKTVTFLVNGLDIGDNYSLTISNVQDFSGNTIVTTNVTGTAPDIQIDYALIGTATESSDPFGFPAANAIDGNLSTFSHTGNSDNEWLEVDLGSPRTIGDITVWFRGAFRDRDEDLLLTVLDAPGTRNLVYSNFLGAAAPPNPTNVLIAPPVTGQIVRIEHPAGLGGTDMGYLTINELIVSPVSQGFAIVQPPANVAVVTNSPAVFSVGLVGPGPFTYQWQYNSNNISGATNSTLVIPAAGPAQAGNYTVIVNNPFRTHTSPPAVLSLLPPAIVSPIVKIRFHGSLNGTVYTLGPGDVDVTGTFAGLTGSEVVSNGSAYLSSAIAGEGFSVTNTIVDGGNGIKTNFVIEMMFTPTANFAQGVGENAAHADIFTVGSIYYTDTDHADGIFALDYITPTNEELRVDSITVNGIRDNTAIPTTGVLNHLAVVYQQGPGQTNNTASYYLNGTLIDTIPLALNVGSASAGGVQAVFGNTLPSSSFNPRGIDGALQGVAYATFSGSFSPFYNFQLFEPPVVMRLTGLSQVTLSWFGVGVLQQNTNLSNSAGWSDVAGGGTSPVTQTVGAGNRYYRLRKP
ncbi:MAG TPA: discoidin domain-containing protein [Verrucomicrobiae bacterium]|nr:discoidin domain-containing protein [Verrucomicrobiae bacterium]